MAEWVSLSAHGEGFFSASSPEYLGLETTLIALALAYFGVAGLSLRRRQTRGRVELDREGVALVRRNGTRTLVPWDERPFVLSMVDLRARPAELGEPGIYLNLELPRGFWGLAGQDAFEAVLSESARHKMGVERSMNHETWNGRAWKAEIVSIVPGDPSHGPGES